MIALLDAGNSRFKWARLRDGSLSAVASQAYGTQDRPQAVLAALERSGAPRRIVVASVLGDDFKEQFMSSVAARLGFEPEFVTPMRSACGIRLAYENPTEFGADRFAALVAARRVFQRACIIVDGGTAVTIDALAADGRHLGGLILPGLELMRRSLIEHTARITTGLGQEDGLFGRSTSQGVSGGTLRGLVGAIDRIVADMTRVMNEHRVAGGVQYVITGGAGPHLLKRLTADYQLEPRLVLQGLAIIANSRDC